MDDRSRFISAKYGIPRIELDQFDILPEVVALLPGPSARKLNAIPVVRTGSTLIVAMVEPTDVSAIDHLAEATGFNIEVVVASADELAAARERYYPT